MDDIYLNNIAINHRKLKGDLNSSENIYVTYDDIQTVEMNRTGLSPAFTGNKQIN